MHSDMFQSTTIPVLQEVVSFTQSRHNVLAGNIANINVPGYKTHDLSVEDFQMRLKEAIEERNHPTQRSPGETNPPEPIAAVAKNSKTIMRHDENNVDFEHQTTEVLKNQVEHNTALALLIQQFRQLDSAISGRV